MVRPDGKHLWTASWDNTARLWDAATGKQLCALVIYEGGDHWLVVTPDGYFDGNAGGKKYMAWRFPGSYEIINDEETYKKFHRPDLLAKLLKGENPIQEGNEAQP